MNKFESEIKAGNFVTSECIMIVIKSYGHQVIIVIIVLMEVNWRKVSPNGKLIEWSKKIMIFFVSLNLKIQYVL